MIPSAAFYSNYHGHLLSHLQYLHEHTFPPHIWLAGDSTLDNKYWLPQPAHPPPPQYTLLQPPLCARDVAYWLTKRAPPSHPYTAINCAVEESTLRERERALLPQDQFVQKNICADDILVVSVGGNDIALRPTLGLAFAAFQAVYFNATPSALHSLFVTRVQAYIEQLVSRERPRLVVVCALYFLDEAATNSWANGVLRLLAYDWRPRRLQNAQRRLYHAMKQISVEGTKVVVLPMFEALDGKQSSDYVARVEPSEKGGEKMAAMIWEAIQSEIAPVRE